MFRFLPPDHLQGSSLVLSAYHVFASRFVICLYWYAAVCPLQCSICINKSLFAIYRYEKMRGLINFYCDVYKN
jgi:hypothetical protein